MKTTLKADSHTRTRIRTRARTRRLSACNRHPDEPVTGICAACLRERLSSLDPSAAADASSSAFSSAEELRRCRSVSAAAKSVASCSSYNEPPRRKSCDVRARNTLADHLLFDKSGPIGSVKAESNNLGFYNDNDNAEVAEGEVKTMKEYIDLLIQGEKHQKKPKDLASFWEAASVFSKKLQKWRLLKHKNKYLGQGNASSIIDDGNLKPWKMGQRETTRLSVDAGRMSVDGSRRISFDEPRASWDGYLIARTIPRLAPLLSVVENGMLWGGNRFDCHRLSVDGQMQSIIEDESSPAGGSGQSNFDSSSSQRWSSFDRSVSLTSSSKKTVAGLESDEANSISPAKLVITERELKDWQLKSSGNKDDNCGNFDPIGKAATSGVRGGNFDGSKKSTRWRKMFNVLNMIPKSSDNKCENLTGNEVDSLVADGCEGRENGGEVKETSGCKRSDSGSVANRRKSFDMFGFNQTMRNSKEVKEASGWKLERSNSVARSRNSFDVSGLKQSMRNGGEVEEASSWKLECSDSVARSRNSFDVSGLNQSMRNGEVKEASGWKFSHCGSLASSRRSLDMIGLNHDTRSVAKDTLSANKGGEDFVLELKKSARNSSSSNKSARNSSCKIDDDALPFYFTPLRSSKSSKSGRHRPQNSLSLNGNILQLN